MKRYLLSLILFVPFVIFGQEVYFSNQGFETYKKLPDKIAEGKRCISGWTIPVLTGQGDYYHVNALSNQSRTDHNYFGKQEPHSGEAYAGICITGKFREFLHTELTKPLEKGKKYQVELYISKGDKKYLAYVQEFGVIFTEKELQLPDNDVMIGQPSIRFKEEKGYKNHKEWIKLTAIYEASGTEKHFTFGSFLFKENGQIKGGLFGTSKYAHYYVDDFSIVEIREE